MVGAVVMETAPAVTVVGSGQVDTVGVVMTDGHALDALVHVSVTVVSGESWGTEAGVRSHTRASVSAAVFTKRSADGAVAHISRFAGAEVASHCVGADGFFITAQSRRALVMFCAGVLVDSCVPGDTVAAVAPGDVDTDGVDLTEVSLGRALVDIFTVGVVSVHRGVSRSALTLPPGVQVPALRVLSTQQALSAEIMTSADVAAASLRQDLLAQTAVQLWTRLQHLHHPPALAFSAVAREEALSFCKRLAQVLTLRSALLTAGSGHMNWERIF